MNKPDMLDPSFPLLCPLCKKALSSLVPFCPFCGEKLEVNTPPAEPPNVEPLLQQNITAPSPAEPPNVEPLLQQNITAPSPAEPPNVEPLLQQNTSPLPPGEPSWGKRIAIALIVSLLVGGAYYINRKPQPQPQPPSSSLCPEARSLAFETLAQGTTLSRTISKLPKQEKVLEAAQKLGAISPTYREQVTTAEQTVKTARKSRDTTLMTYLGKLLELSRRSPKEMKCAMDLLQNGDLSPREKIVVDLLSNHEQLSRNNKCEPGKLLSDFTNKFSTFID